MGVSTRGLTRSDAQLFTCCRHLQHNELKRMDRHVLEELSGLEYMYVFMTAGVTEGTACKEWKSTGYTGVNG